MHLIIKLPNTNLEIDLEPEASVESLRSVCAQKLDSQPEDVCLVYKGKIMRDKDVLKNLDVIDGSSIHCALKKSKAETFSANPVTSTSQPSKPAPTSTQPQKPKDLPSFGNLNLNALQQLDQVEDLNEFSRFIAESNIVDNISNMSPEHKKFFEAYPDILHSLKDPSTVKQILEAMKNPNIMKDLLANQDQMLNQLQTIPGGIQEYMNFMKKIQSLEQHTVNKLPNLTAQVDGTSVNVSGEAMPNPWNQFKKSGSNSERNKYVIEDEDNPLYRDTIRALRLMDGVENDLAKRFATNIRNAITHLTPRGIYGLTEFVKGMEVIKEESPELIAFMLNFQLASLRLPPNQEVPTSDAAEPDNAAIPPENGTEETYQQQLAELDTMGFNNKEENISALRHSYGDVAAAVDWILRRRGIQ